MKTRQTSALSRPTPATASGSGRILRSHTAAANAAQAAANSFRVTKNRSSPRTRRPGADPWLPKRKTNPNPRPRPPPPSHFTCRICIEEQPSTEFVRWVPPVRGRYRAAHDAPYPCILHLARNPKKKNINPVCKTCIGRSMEAKIDMLGARHVGAGCLEPGCQEPWHDHFIMMYITGAALEKYNIEMFEVWKTDMTPKFFTCLSPTCNASGLPDVMAPGFPQVACHKCSLRACAQCSVPWHEGLSCAEVAAKAVDKKMSAADQEILKFMQTLDGRRCPNCQLVIEKDGGCGSMHCPGCNKFFNWESAASAIAGSRKAEPYVRDVIRYWNNPNAGPVVCEQDALDAVAASRTTDTVPSK